MPVIIPTITFYANNVVSVVSLDSTPYFVIQNSMGSFIYGLKELYLKAIHKFYNLINLIDMM